MRSGSGHGARLPVVVGSAEATSVPAGRLLGEAARVVDFACAVSASGCPCQKRWSMIELDGVEDAAATVVLRAGDSCTGFDSAEATSKVAALIAGFVRGSGTAAAVTIGFSGLASTAATVVAFGA